MTSTGGLFSQTLQEITHTKLEELEKKRRAFEAHRHALIDAAENNKDVVRRLEVLSDGIKKCFSVSLSDGKVVRGSTGNARLEIELTNLDRFLAQARYDPCISKNILGKWNLSLIRHLDTQSLKFAYGTLYGQITMEWLSTEHTKASRSSALATDADEEDYHEVGKAQRMEERMNWEHSVFESKAISQSDIIKLLQNLFEATPEDSKHLTKAMEWVRKEVKQFEQHLVRPTSFTSDTIDWVIQSLLTSNLLTEKKRSVLKDFRTNSTILNEIADVLNMRLGALDSWSWGDVVQLEERRHVNGAFNIYMHEDILQAIFLQYIGMEWSVFFKDKFSQFYRFEGVWKKPEDTMSITEKKRRDFFLGPTKGRPNIASRKRQIYRTKYFLSQLYDFQGQEMVSQEGAEEAQVRPRRRLQTARKTAAPTHMSPQMQADKEDADFESSDCEGTPKTRNPVEAKQEFLHLLTTDILISSRVHGELTIFRSQFDDLYPSLPHATIEQVLSFFGVSQKWLSFFTKFLQAPLQFMDEKSAEPRKRMSGIPGSHVLSEVFSEVVLFCLDFQINQSTAGELLWRMQDDFWFWSSDSAKCARVWETIVQFAKTIGLSLNNQKSGSTRLVQKKGQPHVVPAHIDASLPQGLVRWGMLYLNPRSGRFEIDQNMVDEHINELRRQLQNKTHSIFAWIQAWNTYVSTFFNSNFGKSAGCFGRQHVDDMLATHERIQREIFQSSPRSASQTSSESSSSVIDYLRNIVTERFGVTDIPDGFFFLPTELGGLEIQSPFVGLLQIRESLPERPTKLLDNFEESEKEAYRAAKTAFESGRTHKRHHELDDPSFRPKDPSTFISFEEYIKNREVIYYNFPNNLFSVYTKLLERPRERAVEGHQSGLVESGLSALNGQGNLRGIMPSWNMMKPYWQWYVYPIAKFRLN